MLAFIRYTAGLGNSAIYVRLRNSSGQFWDFVGLSWVGTETADCKVNMVESDDSDPADSLYTTSITVPSGGPYIQEAVQASDNTVVGSDTTAIDAPIATRSSHSTADVKLVLEADGSKLASLASMVDAIATFSELQAMFDQIKGPGWTDETLEGLKTLIDNKVSGSINVVSAVNGSLQVDPVKDGGIITIYRKTKVAITFNLGKNMTGRKLYFAVRKDVNDAGYTIPNGGTTPKEITLTTDLATGSGYVDLSTTETNIPAALYAYAEIQSISNAGGDPIPEQIFQLKVKDHALNL